MASSEAFFLIGMTHEQAARDNVVIQRDEFAEVDQAAMAGTAALAGRAYWLVF